jgi:hypothetical protein
MRQESGAEWGGWGGEWGVGGGSGMAGRGVATRKYAWRFEDKTKEIQKKDTCGALPIQNGARVTRLAAEHWTAFAAVRMISRTRSGWESVGTLGLAVIFIALFASDRA